MIDGTTLRGLRKDHLLADFSRLVDDDRRNTAALVAYIAEIDRRKLFLEHACPSMFAFLTERFGMSEAIAFRRIRAGRATSRFPCILEMLACGEIHLTGVHQLASHLTEENHRELLQRARRRSTRDIEKLIAEVAPRPDVPSRVRALPTKKGPTPLLQGDVSRVETSTENPARASTVSESRLKSRPIPLAPRRYKLQVTIGQETRDKLEELQGLLSHQIPDGDPAEILDRAFDALLAEARKKKAALTDRPHRSSRKSKKQNRGIPARVRREVFERDDGRCTFIDSRGRRCGSTWQVEFHHRLPYARGGTHDSSNLDLRCRAHNQYEAEREYGAELMKRARTAR